MYSDFAIRAYKFLEMCACQAYKMRGLSGLVAQGFEAEDAAIGDVEDAAVFVATERLRIDEELIGSTDEEAD